MLHAIFTMINFIALFCVLFIDRARARFYAVLFAAGLPAAFVFENVTTFLGFWVYHSEPKVLLISLYTWLLYMPYLGFCYFLGRRLSSTGGGR